MKVKTKKKSGMAEIKKDVTPELKTITRATITECHLYRNRKTGKYRFNANIDFSPPSGISRYELSYDPSDYTVTCNAFTEIGGSKSYSGDIFSGESEAFHSDWMWFKFNLKNRMGTLPLGSKTLSVKEAEEE